MSEYTEKENKLSLKWLPLAWFSFIFNCIIFGVIIGIVQGDPIKFILKSGIVGSTAIFAIIGGVYGVGMIVAIGMIIAVGILFFLMRKNGISFSRIGLKGKLSIKGVGYAIVGTIIAFFMYPLIETIIKALGTTMYWGNNSINLLFLFLSDNLVSLSDIALMFIFAVVFSPVLEEILFRGYILTTLMEKMKNRYFAILLAALIFTSIHLFLLFFGPGLIVYIFFWSFIPTFLYLKTKNLYSAMLMHSLNNLLAYLILPLLGI